MFLGNYNIGDTVYFNFQALDGNGTPIDPTGNVNYSVYSGNAPMSPAVSGTMAKIDSKTGFYGSSIDLSQTSGFRSGRNYTIHITATIDGVSTARVYHFNCVADELTLLGQYPGLVSGSVSGSQTILDRKFLPKVLQLIDRLGKTVVFRTYPDAAYDPETGETTLGDPLDYTKKIIPPYAYEQKYIDGDNVQAGDMQSGIAALGLEFTPIPSTDKLIIDTQEWNIVNSMPVYSGQQIAMYLFQLRRA